MNTTLYPFRGTYRQGRQVRTGIRWATDQAAAEADWAAMLQREYRGKATLLHVDPEYHPMLWVPYAVRAAQVDALRGK